MWLSRIRSLPGPGRRRWWFIVIALMTLVAVVFVLSRPMEAPATQPASSPPAVAASPAPTKRLQAEAPAMNPPSRNSAMPETPRTVDYRKLASAAAEAVYTWDTRTASYSEVYSRLRSWWKVLPDGSNPLAVFVQEFEATGINAGTYALLTGQQAHRGATVQSVRCDLELAKVRERPAPWAGLHVCTVALRVLDRTTSSRNLYTAPVSVMMNCPPAETAPADHCVMVAFYASANRIVY